MDSGTLSEIADEGPGRSSSEGWPGIAWVAAYVALYFAYLWVAPESEILHWVSLVALPWTALWILSRHSEPGLRFRDVGRRLGLAWPDGGRGMGWALGLVVAVQGIQLLNQANRELLAQVLPSSQALWMVPAALLFGLLTAGFTEEFFFRGIVQRSLAGWTGSPWMAVAGASVVFALYHVPYAYLNPHWPSAGDLPASLMAAGTNGLVGGVILGLLFVRGRGSLVPCVLVHAAVDWVPVMHLLSRIQIHF